MKEFLRPRIVAKLDGMVARHTELTAQSGDPNVLAQPERSANVQRELGRLSGVVMRYEAYRGVVEQLEQACALIAENDAEMAELAREEVPELERSAAKMAGEILDSLLMQSGDNQRSAIKVDICAECHPFFTGAQTFVDTAGRVDKFRRRSAKSQAPKS